MTRLAWDAAVERHRGALEEAVTAVSALGVEAWSRAPRKDKWTPAEIAEHLILSYQTMLSELSGGPGFALRVRGPLRILVRWKFLPAMVEKGRFPSGVRAPREARPQGGSSTPAEAAARLAENGGRLETELSRARAAGGGRLTHPYFGRVDAVQSLAMVAAHLRHHVRQLPSS